MTIEGRILRHLRQHRGKHTPKEIANALGIPNNVTRMMLHRLVQKRAIYNPRRGVYCSKECKSNNSGGQRECTNKAKATPKATTLANKIKVPSQKSNKPGKQCDAKYRINHHVRGNAHVRGRVLKFLQKHVPDEYNPKTIARLLRLNYHSVRSALSRLAREYVIVRAHKGFYRAKIRAEDLKKIEYPTVSLHGIKLECNIPTLHHNWGRVFPLMQMSSPARLRHENIITTTMWFETRRLTITLHKMGLVEIFCKTSDAPIDYPTFTRLVWYIAGVLHFLGTDLWKANPRIRQVGLNCDYRYLRLDGISNIKLQTFTNAWAQIYQKKKDLMRVEQHLVTNLSLAEAVTILSALQPIKVVYTKPDEKPDKNDVSYIS